MKPKPFSIRQRFFLLQTFSIALALWFVVAAVYVSLHVRRNLTDPAQHPGLENYTRILYLLLVASGLVAVLIFFAFRRAHEVHLWGPVRQIGEMVREVRRGNLNLSVEVPRSVELGPVTDSIVQMAEELRVAKEALEKKMAQQTAELDTTQQKLLESAKLAALGQLVSGVAHEVNNPLTSILGFSEVALGNPGLDAATRRHIQIIRDEALRLRNVVANLSSFARRAPQHTSRIDLRKVLDRAVELRRYQLASSGIELHAELPAEAVWVEGDGDQLLQVIFNLLLNAEQAIKAVREKGDIWLGCQPSGSEVRIWVRDNGAGMTTQVLERIFEPYFTTKAVGEGSGLGLSVSHGVVAQHRGRIIAASAPGAGSTFTVILPMASETTAGAAAPGLTSAQAATQGRALVIDDEPAVANFVREALTRRGWNVTVLTDSNAAERTVEGAEFDFVISDLKMPGKNGMAIFRMLQEKKPELARRFLLMTGDLSDSDQRTLKLSVVTVLRKPFTLAQLDEAIRTVQRQNETSPTQTAKQ